MNRKVTEILNKNRNEKKMWARVCVCVSHYTIHIQLKEHQRLKKKNRIFILDGQMVKIHRLLQINHLAHSQLYERWIYRIDSLLHFQIDHKIIYFSLPLNCPIKIIELCRSRMLFFTFDAHPKSKSKQYWTVSKIIASTIVILYML